MQENEKMLVTSIFSFSHNVFRRIFEQGRWVVKGHHCIVKGQLFPKWYILDSSKLKELADNDFKFDKNGRKFSKQVENIVGKREIDRYKQFLLFSQCFQEIYTINA